MKASSGAKYNPPRHAITKAMPYVRLLARTYVAINGFTVIGRRKRPGKIHRARKLIL